MSTFDKPTAESETARADELLKAVMEGGSDTGAWPYNRPCAQQYVGKSQSCMVISGRLIGHAPVQRQRQQSRTQRQTVAAGRRRSERPTTSGWRVLGHDASAGRAPLCLHRLFPRLRKLAARRPGKSGGGSASAPRAAVSWGGLPHHRRRPWQYGCVSR